MQVLVETWADTNPLRACNGPIFVIEILNRSEQKGETCVGRYIVFTA